MPQEKIGTRPFPHYGQHGGMDYGTEPHLLKENQFRLLKGLRVNGVLQQVPKLKLLTSSAELNNMDALVNLPNGRLDYGLWLAFTNVGVHQLRTNGLQTAMVTLTPSTDRIVTHVYNGKVFFANRANRVRYVDSNGVHELWEHRRCWTKDNGDADLLGQGPFTGEPLMGGVTPVGDLTTSFTWTTGRYYRVYVERPNYFPRYSTIRVTIYRDDRTTSSFTGRVTAVEKDYVVVRALTTVTNVPNTANSRPHTVEIDSMDIPSGRYVTTFFDHVVVGAPSYKGASSAYKVSWCHLYDFAQWEPGTASEADSYTCSDYQYPDDIVTGLSGVAHYGELLFLFTTSCVYAMSYTGLPRVVRVAPLIQGYGNGLPFAVAQLDRGVVWCDVHNRSFYLYRGNGPEDIGQPIADYFFENLISNSTFAAKTWCYVNRAENEVGWVYCSGASGGLFDSQVVFNYRLNAWSTRHANGATCFGSLGKRAKTIHELSGTIHSQVGFMDTQEETTDVEMVVWGGAQKKVYREEVSTDADADLVSSDSLRAETGDLIYGSAQVVKEVKAMTINATHSVKVYVSAREHFDDAVSFTLVGTWTTTTPEKLLTFTPIVGKILRYAFEPAVATRNFVFRGYEDNVLSAGAYR